MGLKVSKKEILKVMADGEISLSLDCGTDKFWLNHAKTGKSLFVGTITAFFRATGVKHIVDWRI